MRPTSSLYDRIAAAFVWLAAFCFACGVFLAITLTLGWLPPTKPTAVGLVTIERYSKLRDYVQAGLFFLLVPPLTIWLHRVIGRAAEAHRRAYAWRGEAGSGSALAASLFFTSPFILAPFFYLTTGKAGWILVLPLALAWAGPRVLFAATTRKWIRDVFGREERPYHALLFTAGVSWILLRYIVTGRRIGHIPTLFLEVVFVGLFLALFWAAALLITRLATLLFAVDTTVTFRRIAIASLPIVLLPFLATAIVPLPQPRLLTAVTLGVCVLIAWKLERPMPAQSAWRLAALLIVPALIYLVSYASTAHLHQWIDLFHRGETLGPASDYLRGKAPYSGVYALHGMLEDGLLDAWLMKLFGRSIEVALLRHVILGAFLGTFIYYLGISVFRSIPLALLFVAMGSWTTAENSRTFLQIAVVALFWVALRRHSRIAAVLAGVVAAVALFHSYEIGTYSIAGGIAAAVALLVVARRVQWDGMPPLRALVWFAFGVALGVSPFAIYLAARGSLDDFLVTSFVTIPNIIDAVWSLPFPDLVSTFRRDLSLHALSEFILYEKFHLILSPLTIAVAAIYYIQRWLSRRADMLDHALMVITVFATVAQRTAFGRAEFRHQYFAAFLIGPMLVILAVLAARALRRVASSGGEGTRAFVGIVVAGLIATVGVLFWIPDLLDARLNELVRYYARVTRADADENARQVEWRIREVSREIQKLTRPGEPIFDFSNQPAFYFFANRPNPTRFYQIPILSPREFQDETIRALEASEPRVIIRRSPELYDQFDGVTNDLRAQAVSAYIHDVYRFHRNVRGVELWVRQASARPRPPRDYLARIRVPERDELVSGYVHRIVFPAVGSVGGAGGSYWQSDLTMHNPFRDPISVSLRYVAGDIAIDRRLQLRGRQTLRWNDVVKTFFGVEGVVGTLWVEHHENRAPVAVVKTFDAAHGGRASVEQPLSGRDAATAQTDVSELAIVGVPAVGPEPRRVNVGVVNIGIIPATFRITARNASGAEVGRPLESGIPEGEVWLLPDIESRIGVRLDETTTLRLTAIAGTGVGFATVIESNGDSEFIAAVPAQQRHDE